MLEAISLKFTEFAQPLRIPVQGVTIFVGPNNSGKSLVLREIQQDIVSHQRQETKILHDLEIAWMTEATLNEEIAELTKKAPAGISPDNVYVSGFDQNGQLYGLQPSRNALLEYMREQREPRWIASQFLRMFSIGLDGRARFALTSDRPRGDLLGPPQHMLMQLFVDDQARKRVREIVFDAFGVYFTIEQLSQNLRIRLSATEPDENEQPRQNCNEPAWG
jgi:hypothetical protein